MTFHENLFRLRKGKGLSQEELGNRLNVARQTVSKWETGETTPELEKLIQLAEFFEISMDELVGRNCGGNASGNAAGASQARGAHDFANDDSGCLRSGWYAYSWEYEYKSKTRIRGIPLVHINIGRGLRRAKGIIAVGNIAQGVVAIGGAAVGIFTLAAVGVGVFSIGALVVGLLMAWGAIAVGLLSVGAIAVGGFAVGALAVGNYAVGSIAVANQIAMGSAAFAPIAIGDYTNGTLAFYYHNGIASFDPQELREAIQTQFPHTWQIVVDLFTKLLI